MKRYFSFSIVAILALGANVYAADTEDNTAKKLDTISIVSDSLGYSDVDSAKISLNQASLLSQTLRDVPGIYVGGTNGINQQINMRGVTNRGINITLDGAKQVGNVFHHAPELMVDPELIKQVKASVGVNSVTQGIGALGGSMAFETVDASDLLEDDRDFGFKLSTGYGSNNKEWGKSLTLYGRAFESLDLLGYIKHSSHDFGETGDGNDVGGDGDDLSILLKGTGKISDNQKVSLSYSRMKYSGDYTLRANMPVFDWNRLMYQKFIRNTYTLDYSLHPNDYVDLRFNAYYTKNRYETEVLDNPEISTKGGALKNSSKFSFGNIRNTLNYGIEYADSKAEDTVNSAHEETKSYAIYLEDQIKYGGFTLTPGARYDYAKLSSRFGTTQANSEYGDKNFHDFTSSITARYDFNFGLGLFAGYTQLFRAPDVIEAMRLEGDYFTDSNLKAETGDNKEVGFNYKLSFNDTISMDIMAKYYKTKYDRVIGYDGGNDSRVNAGALTIDGYEALANFYIADLKVGLGYSSSDIEKSELLGNYGFVIGKDVGDKYTFNTEYFISPIGVTAGWNTLFIDSKKTTVEDDDGNPLTYTKPSYAVSDLYVQWQPNSGKLDGLSINFGIYNIFDKNYASHTSFGDLYTNYADGEPGRNVKVSFSYKY